MQSLVTKLRKAKKRQARSSDLAWLFGAALYLGGCAFPLENKVSLGVSTTLIVTDCGITAHQLRGQNVETNPLLGFHPIPAKLWGMCGAGLALNAGFPAAVGMGKHGKTAWWIGIATIETWAIASNLGRH